MKKLLRSFLVKAIVLWIVSQLLVNGITFAKGYETLAVAAVVLGLVNLFIRPLLNILFLPINVLTLGAFRWIINVVTLFLVTLLVPDFKINAFHFPGLSYFGLSIPAFDAGTILAFIIISFLLSLFTGLIFWVIK